MMTDVGLGDVLFIIFILGVIHGIMHWVNRLRQRKREIEPEASDR
jgi:hypothetical protein